MGKSKLIEKDLKFHDFLKKTIFLIPDGEENLLGNSFKRVSKTGRIYETEAYNGSNNYKKVSITYLNKLYVFLWHRVKFFLVNDYFPNQIDHENQIRYDNRICNLKSSNFCLNARNRTTNSINKSIYNGVYLSKTKLKNGDYNFYWTIKVCLKDKKQYTKTFKTELEAAKEFNRYIIENNLEDKFKYLNKFDEEII